MAQVQRCTYVRGRLGRGRFSACQRRKARQPVGSEPSLPDVRSHAYQGRIRARQTLISGRRTPQPVVHLPFIENLGGLLRLGASLAFDWWVLSLQRDPFSDPATEAYNSQIL